MGFNFGGIPKEQKNNIETTYYDPARQVGVKNYDFYNILDRNINNLINSKFETVFILTNNLKENIEKSEQEILNIQKENKTYTERISKLESKIKTYETIFYSFIALVIIAILPYVVQILIKIIK